MLFLIVPDGPPRDIRLIDTDPAMLTVRYIPPEPSLRNGDITGYKLRYTRVESGESKTKNISRRARQTVITGLEAYTMYSVALAAVTINGTGPFSDAVNGLSGQASKRITLIHYYLLLHKILEPSAPRSLSADDIQSTSIILSWLPPNTPNGIIMQYEVQYNADNETSFVNFTATRMRTVGGLSPSKVYTLQVRAYTKVGAGPFSNNITVADLPECKLQ